MFENIQYPEILIFLCLVIIVLIMLIFDKYYRMRKCILGGFWSAPAQFCMQSGLKDASVLINPDDGTMFVIMSNCDGIVLSKIVGYHLSGNGFSETIEGVLTFDESMKPLPDSCNVKINVNDGMMGLYDDDNNVVMVLYKDNKSTAGIV
jgi:hypothetical protein